MANKEHQLTDEKTKNGKTIWHWRKGICCRNSEWVV